MKFQQAVCNHCHDELTISIELKRIAILITVGVDYHCTINEISKTGAINLLKNADLSKKSGSL